MNICAFMQKLVYASVWLLFPHPILHNMKSHRNVKTLVDFNTNLSTGAACVTVQQTQSALSQQDMVLD